MKMKANVEIPRNTKIEKMVAEPTNVEEDGNGASHYQVPCVISDSFRVGSHTKHSAIANL